MRDDPPDKDDELWILEIAATVKKIRAMPARELDDFIFNAWDEAIVKAFQHLHPDFLEGWNSIPKEKKKKIILPGKFKDKSYVYFHKVTLEAVNIIINATSLRGKA